MSGTRALAWGLLLLAHACSRGPRNEDARPDAAPTGAGPDAMRAVKAADSSLLLADPQKPPQAHAVLDGHQGEVSSLSYTPDGRYLISASYGDYSIRSWRADTGEPVQVAKAESRVRDLVVSPDGKAVFTTDAGKNVQVWPLESGRLGSPRLLVAEAGEALAVSGDGLVLATAGHQAPLRLWNASDGTLAEELKGAPNQRVLAFVRDGSALVTGGEGNTYGQWVKPPARSGSGGWQETRRTISRVGKDGGGISSLDVSGDGTLLATGHLDSSIVLVDLPTGREIFNVFVTDAATRDVKLSPAEPILATAQQDRTVYLWDTRTGRQVAALRKHADAVDSLAFSPDGRTLATGGEDRRIVLWRAGAPPTSVAEVSGPGGAKTLDAGAFVAGTTEYKGRRNFVKDPYAYHCATAWQRKGQAACETSRDGSPHFAVRYGGSFWQDAPIPESTGRYLLLVARAASERVDPDGDQTGLPYLYGYAVNRRDPNRFNGHLHGQQMMLQPSAPHQWGTVWGVFPVPAETGAIRVFLQQADGRQAQTGTAALFDDVGLFVFETEGEARTFAEGYER